MGLSKAFKAALLAGSLFSATGAAAQENILDVELKGAIDQPSANCIVNGAAIEDTPHTQRLLALSAKARSDSQMGAYLVDTIENKTAYAFCVASDPLQIGTSRIKLNQDAQGMYQILWGTVSDDKAAYPNTMTDAEYDDYQAFGMLEEYAHGLTNMSLLLNAQMDVNNFAALLSLTEAIQKIWADEALASSAAIIAARQQYENGNTAMWDAISKFDIYHHIVDTIDEAAENDIRDLYNGEAHVAGFVAWYDTPELRARAVQKVSIGYEQQLTNFKALGAPVDVQDFGPRQILEMASFLGAYEAFANKPGLLATVMSPLMFEGLPQDFIDQKIRIESDARTYMQQHDAATLSP